MCFQKKGEEGCVFKKKGRKAVFQKRGEEVCVS